MSYGTWLLALIISLTGILLGGCAKSDGQCRGGLGGGPGGPCIVEAPVAIPTATPEPMSYSPFRCVASLMDASGSTLSVANHDQWLSLKIEATGGVAPYAVPGLISSFASLTTLFGAYLNTGTTERVIERNVEVRDSQGALARCPFRIVIRPAGVTPSTSRLGCEIEVTPSAPRTGQTTNIKVKVLNGSGATHFRQLYPQHGWGEWTVGVSRISDSEGEVLGGVQYGQVGERIIAISIENNSQTAICSKRITVVNPTLSLTSTVSGIHNTVASIGSEFSIQAIAEGLTSPVIYQFSTTEPNISIVASGGTARVLATDSIFHDFRVNVRASGANGESASNEIQLRFTAAIPLACRLDVSGSATVNSPLTFSAVATSSGERLEITEMISRHYGTSNSFGNPFVLTFSSTGLRIVSVRARSITSQVPCNLSMPITAVVNILERELVCNVSTGIANGAASGSVSKVQVTVPRSAGSGPFELIELLSSLPATSYYDRDNSSLWQRVSFRRPGSHTVTARIRDTIDGRTGECSSIHIARRADAFAAGTDRYHAPRVSVFTGSNANLSRSFLAFDASFTGGVRVAMGDVDANGTADLIAGSGFGSGARIRVFHGSDLTILRDFYAFPGVSMNDVYVASGDIDGDGRAEVIAGSGCSANQPRVRVFNGVTASLTRELFPYGTSGTGARVAVGDVNGDGYADIVTAPCTGSEIKIFSGLDFSLIRGIIAYPSSNRESQIAVGDVNGDGFAEVVTGGNGTSGDREFAKVFDGRTGLLLHSIAPFPSFAYDTRVAVGDVTGDGISEVLFGAGGHLPFYSEIQTYDGISGGLIPGAAAIFRPFGTSHWSNLFLAAGF